MSADDARVAAGIGGTGAERLSGAGDFVAVAGGQVTSFQAAFIPDQDILAMIDKLWEQNPELYAAPQLLGE